MKNKFSMCIVAMLAANSFAVYSTPTVGDLDKSQSNIQLLKAKNEELALQVQEKELSQKLGVLGDSNSQLNTPTPTAYVLTEIMGGMRGLSASFLINGRHVPVKKGDTLPDGSVVKSISRTSVNLQLNDGRYYQVKL